MIKYLKIIFKFFNRTAVVIKSIDDPVRICEVYRDKQNGSCAFVDGMNCDVNNCFIRNSYIKNEND